VISPIKAGVICLLSFLQEANNMNDEYKKIEDFDPNRDMAWYAISFFTNYDNKLLATLNAKCKDPIEFGDAFDECIMISQEIEECVRGKTVKKVVNLMPGYLYCHCVMTDKIWYAIRNTPGVTGIIGSHGKASKPTPIPKSEMEPLLKLIGRNITSEPVPMLKVRDQVKILSGPFADRLGTVGSINEGKQSATLMIESFGRQIEIEMGWSDLEPLKR
jgi:transcriptional antiterminator NusG